MDPRVKPEGKEGGMRGGVGGEKLGGEEACALLRYAKQLPGNFPSCMLGRINQETQKYVISQKAFWWW